MKTKLLGMAGLLGAMVLPFPAHAHTDFSFNLWAPGYVEAPPPVIYYQPAPEYVVPAPNYYYGYAPAYGYGEGWREHEWREHEWREHGWHGHHGHHGGDDD